MISIYVILNNYVAINGFIIIKPLMVSGKSAYFSYGIGRIANSLE